ncbi:MAG: metallophosphoesterase [Lachnospiraceae bacterium]|nr:metallophosphoesterase [Lachnospiraceae bacterium]MDY4069733.1 metallophosphoesterase [Lachnospiraceae bacterium]
MIWILALCAVIAALIFLGIIIRDMNRFVVVSYRVKSTKVKEKFSFVLLSDLHNKSYGRHNEKLAEAILDLKPDCAIVAGDMYTSRAGSSYEHAVELLGAISEKLPVYMANGNHEHKTDYDRKTFGDMYDRYRAELDSYGLKLLVNERVQLADRNISICGSQIGRECFQHFKRFPMPEDYLDKLVGRAEKDKFQILIAHNPDYFEEYAAWGADLVLSGHIHGGIVRFPGLGGMVSPAVKLFPQYDGGIFQIGGSTMILSRGLGTHAIPVRMWNPGELVYVTVDP